MIGLGISWITCTTPICFLTGHQCWIINEGDNITEDGQVAFLSLLDACPSNYHIILTSNEDLDSWSERFQTRFEVYNIPSPDDDEIARGLVDRLRPEDDDPKTRTALARRLRRLHQMDAEVMFVRQSWR